MGERRNHVSRNTPKSRDLFVAVPPYPRGPKTQAYVVLLDWAEAYCSPSKLPQLPNTKTRYQQPCPMAIDDFPLRLHIDVKQEQREY